MNVYLGDIIIGENGSSGPKFGYVDVLVVAGGGAGNKCKSPYVNYPYAEGGGGGGGFVECFDYKLCQETHSKFAITIGAGGIGGNGGDSCFDEIMACGGGYGGFGTNNYNKGCTGGSGGGGGGYSSCSQAGQGINGQGNAGGCGRENNSYSGGGGGGAGSVGGDGCIRGDGGNGKQSVITGKSRYYSGGGAGAYSQNSSTCYYTPGLGSATCGCYGGGGDGYKDGCQGIVYVRYPADGSGLIKGGTGGNKYLCNGYCIHEFTEDGFFTPVYK